MSPLMKYRWISFYELIFTFVGLIIFLYGFFPLKYQGGPPADWSDLPSSIQGFTLDKEKLYSKNRTRVVLMVIDALRYDFVAPKYMPFTSELIKNGSACLYEAQAKPPTVTMPRIKSSNWKRHKAEWRRTINFWRDVFAMTTGSVSNFIDVALNFGSSAVTEDNFLKQVRMNGKHMAFFGDDTWLRLFPDMFRKSEGTTSFFVSDYTEVDLNVTRHLDYELTSAANGPSWDLMILHYLGLDHIGHLEGPSSPKVIPKMAEMDTVITRIVQASKKWKDDTVLIICGDHGMKDSGSHGGASYSEVTVPLVITQKSGCLKKYPTKVDQVDIAPTISYLMDVPIPSGSTGQILPQVLHHENDNDLTSDKALYVLYYNAQKNMKALFDILGKAEATSKDCYKHFKSAEQYHYDWVRFKKSTSKLASNLYLSALNNVAQYLNESVVEFDLFAIITGIIIILQSFVAQVLIMILSYQTKSMQQHSKLFDFQLIGGIFKRLLAVTIVLILFASAFTILCGITQTASCLCKINPISFFTDSAIIVLVISNTLIIMFALKDINGQNELTNLNPIEIFLVVGTVIQALTFGGTSFIEEEHQTWYFFWVSVEFFVLVYTGSVLVDYIRKKNENATEIQDKTDLAQRMDLAGRWLLPQWVLLMILHRFLRTLNQTGDKWAFLPDTGDWLNEEENKNILSPLAILAIICIGYICLSNLDRKSALFKINVSLIIGATLCIFCYRVTTLSIRVPFYFPPLTGTLIVRLFWILIFTMMIIDMLSSIDYLMSHDQVLPYKRKEQMNYSEESVHIHLNTAKHRNLDSGVSETWPTDHPTSRLLSEPEVSSGPCVKMGILTFRTNTFLNIMILVCSLLLRPHNLILVPSIIWTSKIVNNILDYKLETRIYQMNTAKDSSESKNIFCKTIFHIWIGAVFYFYQGNSNSLASIDLGSGYIGLESYIPVIVALQMGIHTYTGPLLAGLLLFVDCVRSNKQFDVFMTRLRECLSTIAVVRIYPIVVYTIIAALLRYHLFVWSVFSPKLLYDLALMYFCLSSVLTMVIICKSVTFQVQFYNKSYPNVNKTDDQSYQPKDL